ncbi:TetR/AcrR family transcriptional regulator [Sphingobacterium sp. SRCM116780]|uniref:TetR/AcrR family transcriptional regulator n=1 Tax=Sphingobacterium sp. SRCM116780 TaxID=2907623 RepID=UPI001F25E586|nr:TetR/AcrR family transcriptional regulator [Sphingobacterium sp. SRCM116780]UIR57180.1 TetR/AcrR family transcriptional regulator [Sphingobacterium sp. SRCM116780]
MGVSERKLRDQEKIKQQIIDQSWLIVQEEGWHSLSIRKIADAIEYSIPVIYKHFENKDAIVEYFTKIGFALLADQLALTVKQNKPADQQLNNLAVSYWNFAFENKKYYEIMFGLGIPKCEVVNSVKEMKAASDVMMNCIARCMEEHQIDNSNLYLKLKTFWSILHGIIAIELISNQETNPEEVSPILKDAIQGFIISLKYKQN